MPPSTVSPMDAACSQHAWLPTFSRQALRSELIELPFDFLSYLAEDGVFAASGALPMRGRPTDAEDDGYRDWSSSSASSSTALEEEEATLSAAAATGLPAALFQRPGSASSSNSSSSAGSEGHAAAVASDRRPWAQRFPDLHARMAACISRLGGCVVPKLNWSCPTDATWVNPSTTLACSNPEQVVVMLKSSDRVGHDLELLQQQQQYQQHQQHQQQQHQQQPQQQPQQPLAQQGSSSSSHGGGPAFPTSCLLPAVLVLRKWYPQLRPEREFRCFVRGRRLVGACQRDISQHFPQLHGPSVETPQPGTGSQAGDAAGDSDNEGEEPVRAIRAAIARFHDAHVAARFPLDEYTYDLYVATDLAVRLLDFNPVGHATSPLLFTWEELGYDPDCSTSGQRDDGGRQPQLTGWSPQQQGDPSAQGAQGQGEALYDGGETAHLGEAGGGVGSLSRPRAGTAAAGAGDDGGAGTRPWPLRVVPPGGGLQAGQRAACGMPYDMLSLQGALGDMAGAMQRGR